MIKTTKTHGERYANGGKRTKEYEAWMGMKKRCYNPKNKDFKNYGLRGIKVCKIWLQSYIDFLSDIGRAPSQFHSIDRIDSNGDYSKSNCRWSTPAEQRRNQRRTKLTMEKVVNIRKLYTGKYGQQTAIAKQFGIGQSTVWAIIQHKKWRTE